MQINNENDQQEVKADVNSNNKTNISTNNIRENKIPTAMYIQAFPTPFFINQQNRNLYNKFQTKKMKTFTERSGDWICNSCRNLNFAFRTLCTFILIFNQSIIIIFSYEHIIPFIHG